MKDDWLRSTLGFLILLSPVAAIIIGRLTDRPRLLLHAALALALGLVTLFVGELIVCAICAAIHVPRPITNRLALVGGGLLAVLSIALAFRGHAFGRVRPRTRTVPGPRRVSSPMVRIDGDLRVAAHDAGCVRCGGKLARVSKWRSWPEAIARKNVQICVTCGACLIDAQITLSARWQYSTMMVSRRFQARTAPLSASRKLLHGAGRLIAGFALINLIAGVVQQRAAGAWGSIGYLIWIFRPSSKGIREMLVAIDCEGGVEELVIHDTHGKQFAIDSRTVGSVWVRHTRGAEDIDHFALVVTDRASAQTSVVLEPLRLVDAIDLAEHLGRALDVAARTRLPQAIASTD
ncbi:MAG TPA: hypothetical protein VER96_22490 [Polyangiaceae bacterium]|nr:hypothetical protein [Polyangiaceae bacterium]